MMVFPEDGIYGVGFSWEGLTSYLEYIPDPRKITWNPCDHPERFPDTEVQFALSCMSKNQSMYIVANMGDRQQCSASTDENCPASGHYQYNTNVVYDPTGLLIARYHKQNLFFEYQFSTPEENPTYFDTPFGRFGVFTCFDIIFYTPTMKLIFEKGIRNIVFPTAWMDVPPHLAAIQFHSAVAAGLNLNFIAANIHWPEKRFQGSGIYSGTGAKTYYYNNSIDSGGKLLIADLDILADGFQGFTKQNKNEHHINNFTPGVFQSSVFADNFNLVELKEIRGVLNVCHNTLCCSLQYELDSNTFGKDLYAFGAFSGLHTNEGTYYLEICMLMKCASTNRSHCGQPATTAATKFSSFEIRGNMSTIFVFPEILLSGEDNMFKLSTTGWVYESRHLKCTNCSMGNALIASSLFGRNFAKDPLYASGSIPLHGNKFISMACGILVFLSKMQRCMSF